MGRQKKNKSLLMEQNIGGHMSEQETANVLEDLEKEIDIKRIELEKLNGEIEEKKKESSLVRFSQNDEAQKTSIDNQSTLHSSKSALQAKIEKQKAYDSQPLTGRFINRRAPGQAVKLTYMKYADDPVKWYSFEDGKVYTIPRGFAEQINEYYHTPTFVQREGVMDPNKPQSQIAHVDTSNKKYAFTPVNF